MAMPLLVVWETTTTLAYVHNLFTNQLQKRLYFSGEK